MSRWWMRVRETGAMFVITRRTGYNPHHGRYGLGYRDQGRVIAALRSSGELIKTAMMWTDLELVNANSATMEQMVTWPVETGFALRHRVEKWYWSSPNNGRVWYSRPGDVEGVWRRVEAQYAREEDRAERRSPATQSLEMVRGVEADPGSKTESSVESLPNWLI